jgi:calcineurin-like phosphoesterase family protein
MTPEDKKKYQEAIDSKSLRKSDHFKVSMESLNKMNNTLIKRWNERVKPEDYVFHVGDFCFKNSKGGNNKEGIPVPSNEWLKKLNGYIIFIRGNHDKNNSTKTIIERLVIRYANKRINLVHDPTKADANYRINFTGHVHNNWQIRRIKTMFNFTDCINVGVDVWNFYPVTFDEIMRRYNQWLRKGEYNGVT